MKILITHPAFYVYGGAERVIIRLANWLSYHNHEVTILSTSMIPQIKKELKEARLILANNWNEVARAMVSDFDVINPHNHPAEVITIPSRRPIVWQCNEPPIGIFTGQEISAEEVTAIQYFVDEIVVADNTQAERIQKLYGRGAKVIHYGLDYDFFNVDTLKAKDVYGIKDNFVILQPGYLTFTKNQVGTVQIFAEVVKNVPNAVLVLAGYDRGPYTEAVTTEAANLGVKDKVIITGQLDQDELRDLYCLACVVISPIKAQGGWLSVFEAMAAGKLVMVSPEMVAAKIIEENQIGLVSHDFVEDIVIAASFIRSADLEAVAKRGKEWVRENLSWEKYCQEMLQAFKDTLFRRVTLK